MGLENVFCVRRVFYELEAQYLNLLFKRLNIVYYAFSVALRSAVLSCYSPWASPPSAELLST